jgi:hypothetical protein
MGRFWQNGSALWDEPVFFVADQQGPLYEAGRFLRMLLHGCRSGRSGVYSTHISELWDSLVRRLQEAMCGYSSDGEA